MDTMKDPAKRASVIEAMLFAGFITPENARALLDYKDNDREFRKETRMQSGLPRELWEL